MNCEWRSELGRRFGRRIELHDINVGKEAGPALVPLCAKHAPILDGASPRMARHLFSGPTRITGAAIGGKSANVPRDGAIIFGDLIGQLDGGGSNWNAPPACG